MKLGTALKINPGTVKYSYCGKYLACGFENELKIVDSRTSEIVSTFLCSHEIKDLDWAFDSDHILCVLDKASKVQAFSLSDPDWVCCIDGGEIGLESAIWNPNGYHILTVAEFNVRISVWSLTGRSVAFIDNLIMTNKNDFAFTLDGSCFAVIVGPLDNYRILIFTSSSWILKNEIQCTCDVNMPSNLLWSPTNLHIAVWETADLMSAHLEIYSVEKLSLIGRFKKSKSLGISSVSWVPSGQFLLIACHNENIYVLNYITWSVLTVLNHSQVIDKTMCQIYEESEENSLNEIFLRPVTLSKLVQSDLLMGITMACDNEGKSVASHCKSMPAVIWIWEVGLFPLKAVIILTNPISHFTWHNTESTLFICSRSRSLVLWNQINPIHLNFAPSNHSLCIKTCYCCPNRKCKKNFAIESNSVLYIINNSNE